MRHMSRVGRPIESHGSVVAPQSDGMKVKTGQTSWGEGVIYIDGVIDRRRDSADRIPTQLVHMPLRPRSRVETMNLTPVLIDELNLKTDVLTRAHPITERSVRQQAGRDKPSSIPCSDLLVKQGHRIPKLIQLVLCHMLPDLFIQRTRVLHEDIHHPSLTETESSNDPQGTALSECCGVVTPRAGKAQCCAMDLTNRSA